MAEEERQEPEDREQAGTYDDAAEKIGWRGPSLVFTIQSQYIRQGQTVLDIGIGTGLGSEPFFRAGLRITGMDLNESMLAVCRRKGFAERLVRHDLTVIPTGCWRWSSGFFKCDVGSSRSRPTCSVPPRTCLSSLVIRLVSSVFMCSSRSTGACFQGRFRPDQRIIVSHF